MLLFPGGFLEPLWQLKPRAHQTFTGMRPLAILLMLAVSSACGAAALGLWRLTRWGYHTGLMVLAINLLGDTINALANHDWQTLIGLPVGGAMMAYLFVCRLLFR